MTRNALFEERRLVIRRGRGVLRLHLPDVHVESFVLSAWRLIFTLSPETLAASSAAAPLCNVNITSGIGCWLLVGVGGGTEERRPDHFTGIN